MFATSFLPSLYPSPRVRPAWWSNGSLNTLPFLFTAIAPNKLLKTLILPWSLPLGLTHRSIPFQVAAFQIFRGYKPDIKKETGWSCSYMIKAIYIYIPNDASLTTQPSYISLPEFMIQDWISDRCWTQDDYAEMSKKWARWLCRNEQNM